MNRKVDRRFTGNRSGGAHRSAMGNDDDRQAVLARLSSAVAMMEARLNVLLNHQIADVHPEELTRLKAAVHAFKVACDSKDGRRISGTMRTVFALTARPSNAGTSELEWQKELQGYRRQVENERRKLSALQRLMLEERVRTALSHQAEINPCMRFSL